MAKPLAPEFTGLFNDADTSKILATIDGDHVPHIVPEPLARVDDHGRIVYFELFERSPSNRNLVRAIWFNGRVAIHARTAGGRSFHVIGRPVKALIAGPVFQKYYEVVRARGGDVDLSTVWIIEPERVDEQNGVSDPAESGGFPLLHLDRIARSSGI